MISHPTTPPPPSVTHSYRAAKAPLRTAPSIEEYVAILKELNLAIKDVHAVGLENERDALGVPVKWVKQQLPGSERVFQVCRTPQHGGGVGGVTSFSMSHTLCKKHQVVARFGQSYGARFSQPWGTRGGCEVPRREPLCAICMLFAVSIS